VPDAASLQPPLPTGLTAHLPKTKRNYAIAVESANAAYTSAMAAYEQKEQQRRTQLEEAKENHQTMESRRQEEARIHNAEVDAFETAFKAGELEAIISYLALVLNQSTYPADFPHEFRLAYVPESKQMVDKMGLDTKLTQASRDGGVDCVAYDPRPILGGKVIIQAKRYKNTVGVSAVRDLFGGSDHNEAGQKSLQPHVPSRRRADQLSHDVDSSPSGTSPMLLGPVKVAVLRRLIFAGSHDTLATWPTSFRLQS
jgi:hypothetical protein